MRSLLAATALLVVMGATPGMARDYPICSRSVTSGFNPSCSFDTMRQCRATISGIGGDCIQNPAFAYGQAGQPRLRGKAARDAARRSSQDSWGQESWHQNSWGHGGWGPNSRW